MKHLRVRWIHSDAGLPVLLYSELSDARWEIRKIEVYSDGRVGWADANHEIGGSLLGQAEVPSLEEINAQEEFDGAEINAEEFEQMWAEARKSNETSTG